MNNDTAQTNNSPSDVAQTSQDMPQSSPKSTPPSDSYVDDYQPPTVRTMSVESEKPESDSVAPAVDSVAPASSSEESLESQNIFFMLGVEDGNEQLRDNFLNELQDVIWDDFLENDVKLLITSEEKVKFDSLIEKKSKIEGKEADEEIQDALVAYLETLIPDLEEIMLEKALDLKSDLFAERITSLKEYHANNSENMEKVNEAEKMMHEDKWRSSADLLNKLDS